MIRVLYSFYTRVLQIDHPSEGLFLTSAASAIINAAGSIEDFKVGLSQRAEAIPAFVIS
jgi:hypothetical protein